MIIDTFCFFQELDMLELRLRYMDSFVDKFVIVESNLTYSGKTKPYNLENNWQRFKPYHNKIEYFQIEQATEGKEFKDVSQYDPTNGPFLLEYEQRNSIMYYNRMVRDEDIVFVSDLDEFYTEELVSLLATSNLNEPYSVTQKFYTNFVNNRSVNEPFWNGTTFTSGKVFKTLTPQEMRDNRNIYQRVCDGYHFSSCGSVEEIVNKIQSFAHVEFDRPSITSKEVVGNLLKEGKDVLQRPGVMYKTEPLTNFDNKFQQLITDYSQFIR